MTRLLFLALALFSAAAFAQVTIQGQVSAGSGTTAATRVPVKVSSDGSVVIRGSATAVDPCASSEIAKSSAIISVTTAATTSLVAVSGTTTVYVCSFAMTISQVVTTANTIKFVRGTGAACVTAPTDLTGAFGTGGVTAAAPITVGSGTGSTQFKTAAGDALCVTTTIGASAAFVGYVTYVQQ